MSGNFFKKTSVPLPGGGDTHFHLWDNGRGFTATTRLRGGFEDHQDFRIKNMLKTPADASGLKYFDKLFDK